MRIKNKILILVMMFCIVIGTAVYAGEASVNKMNIDATIQTNGNLKIVEQVTFNIFGSLNGVFLDILTGTDFASGCVIESISVDNEEYAVKQYAKNGDSGVYVEEDITDGKKIKIYCPSENEKIFVQVEYILENVVTKYTDVAELYWNYIGSGWSNPLKDVLLTIHLPAQSDELKIWGHGPLNGTSQIVDKETATWYINYIPSNTALDARIVFDLALVSGSTKMINKPILDEILIKETELANEANEQREEANAIVSYEKIGIIGNMIWIIYDVAIIVSTIMSILKAKYIIKKDEFDYKYYRELPGDYGPAVMQNLLKQNNYVEGNQILGMILDLVRKKYIQLVEKKTMFSTDYVITKTAKKIDTLKEYEKYFFENILFESDANTTTLNMFKKRNQSSRAYIKYKKLLEKITSAAEDEGLIDREYVDENFEKIRKKPVWCVAIFICIAFITAMFWLESISSLLGISIFVLFGVLIIHGIIIKKINSTLYITEKGIEHRSKWKAFKAYLEDFSNLEEHPVESIAIWEHFLVYAATLGVAKKVIKKLKIMFPNMYEAQDLDGMTVLSMCRTEYIYNSFASRSMPTMGYNDNSSSNFSSGFGGGGGFSGNGGRWPAAVGGGGGF